MCADMHSFSAEHAAQVKPPQQESSVRPLTVKTPLTEIPATNVLPVRELKTAV